MTTAQDRSPSSPVRVSLDTSLGEVVLELYPDRAPISVENFLAYVKEGFYDGLIFHRVVRDFMIQAGAFEASSATVRERPPSRASIRNESDNGLSNERGTIAMARTNAPHSANSQFFINHADNPYLDYGAQGPGAWGYAVFGRVVEGMDVVDAIASVPTTRIGGLSDVPSELVLIRVARVEGP